MIASRVRQFMSSLFTITLGCLIFASGFNMFVKPFQFVMGGVTGLSVIIHDLTGIYPPFIQWGLNIPLFFIGWAFLGNRYAVKIIYGSIFLPFAVLLTEPLQQFAFYGLPTIYNIVFCGIFLGFGLGLILRVNGSTGGIDILARLLSRFGNFSMGKSVALIDGFIIMLGVLIFQYKYQDGFERGVYSLILLFVMSVVIDMSNINRMTYMIHMETLKNKLKKLR